VALTRAKRCAIVETLFTLYVTPILYRHLLIVGNCQMLQSNPLWGRIISYCNGKIM